MPHLVARCRAALPAGSSSSPTRSGSGATAVKIDLEGKVAIVTGAGRGIGREIAATLAGEGVTTVVTDVRQEYLAT